MPDIRTTPYPKSAELLHDVTTKVHNKTTGTLIQAKNVRYEELKCKTKILVNLRQRYGHT